MKYPQKHARDCGKGMTMGELVRMVADAIDAGDEKKASDILDEEFIYGSWGHLLREPEDSTKQEIIYHQAFENLLLGKDIRGLAIVAYRAGRKRERERCVAIAAAHDCNTYAECCDCSGKISRAIREAKEKEGKCDQQ